MLSPTCSSTFSTTNSSWCRQCSLPTSCEISLKSGYCVGIFVMSCTGMWLVYFRVLLVLLVYRCTESEFTYVAGAPTQSPTHRSCTNRNTSSSSGAVHSKASGSPFKVTEASPKSRPSYAPNRPLYARRDPCRQPFAVRALTESLKQLSTTKDVDSSDYRGFGGSPRSPPFRCMHSRKGTAPYRPLPAFYYDT
jgi:hypothetical protein